MSTKMYNLSDFPAFANLLRDTDDSKRDTSTTMYNLSDFPAFANLLRDTDDGKQDTHKADSCHGLLTGHNDVPSSNSNPPYRSSDSNFSSNFNECDADEPHLSVFQYNNDLEASADQSNNTNYENRVIGLPIENECNHSINDPFRRRSNPTVNQTCMARRSPGKLNNLPQRCTTACSRDQLQLSRAIRAEYYKQRDSNQWRVKLWRLMALATGPLLLATLSKRIFPHAFGICYTCPGSAASAASHAARMQSLARYTYGCRCVPRGTGAVTLWQRIGSFSYTARRWLCIISAVAAIVFFAWKWYRRNAARHTSGTFGYRTSGRWLIRRPTSTAGHHHNRTDVPRSQLENVD